MSIDLTVEETKKNLQNLLKILNTLALLDCSRMVNNSVNVIIQGGPKVSIQLLKVGFRSKISHFLSYFYPFSHF